MADEAQKKPVDWRYRVTLALFAIDATALFLWFQLHIEAFVTGTFVVGGTISLWGLWKLIASNWEDAGGDSRKDLTKRFLGGPNALGTLVFVAIVVVLLYALTGSIYLRHGGARAGEDMFRVQVLELDDTPEKRHPLLGPFEMHPGDVKGGPIIPNLRTRELVYEITEPNDFLPLKRTMHWWGAEDVKVPGSFTRKSLHLVVIAPDAALYQKLPPVGEPAGVRYYLTVRAQGKTWTLPEYSQQLVVTGAASEDMPGKKSFPDDARIRDQLRDRFAQQAALVSFLLSAESSALGSAEFGAGEAIEVEVGKWDESGGPRKPVRLLVCNLRAPAGDKPETSVIGESKTEICK